LLKQLKPLLNKVDKFITNECYQPIDTTEGEVEYKKMLTESMMNITKGKIYKCYYQKGEDAYTIINDIGNMDKDWNVVCFEDKTYTHAEFLAQEQAPIEKQQRWSVNVIPMPQNFNDHKISIYLNDGVLSMTEAQKLAEAIKQYLSTNKF
jgi:hypothetical protein